VKLPLKILHTGDLHLGMTFGTRGYSAAVRQQLVEARFSALEKLVATANGENCHLLIVAGDLFHRTTVSQEVILKALKSLGAFNGCVAVLPGNHDFNDGFSPLWKFFRDNNPDDHLVLLSETSPYPLADYGLDVVLYPAPCDAKHSRHNQLGWIRDLTVRPPGRWHVGIAHGAVKGVSPDFDSRYYPMEVEELAGLQMHHWFLGHTHGRYPNQDTARGEVFTYCGTPEPDGFDCNHGGSAWITRLNDEGHEHSESLTPGHFRFWEIHKEINSGQDLPGLAKELAALGKDALVKLTLAGSLPQEEYQGRFQFYQTLEESLMYLEADDLGLTMRVTPENIAAEFAEGSFPQLFLDRLVGRGDSEALQLAYQLVKKVKKC
jgi:DNA repair protein SbcD/Mre11